MKKTLVVFLLNCALAVPMASMQAQRRQAKKDAATSTNLPAERGADQITEAQMRAILSFVASDEMEGRDTPSRGLDATAKFIATNLTRWGLKPAGDNATYFQSITLRRERADSGQTRVELAGQNLTAGEDYIATPTPGSVSGQLVFAGNGWFIRSKNIDAYKDIDARGKIAVIFAPPNGFPRMVRQREPLGKQGEDWMNAIDYARKQGVAGIIYVPDFQYLANWNRNRERIMERGSIFPEKFITQSGAQIPSIIASPKLANAIFQGEKHSAAYLFESAYGSGETLASPFALNPDKKMDISIVTKTDSQRTQNVVAVWEGSDVVLKDEYVALGAHYDHVGIGDPVHGDSIYNGADDDASGTTALLVMAEALARASKRPRRSTLFVWHCGEEKGLWGSRYFIENPTIPIDRIVAHLNMDMIGRSKQLDDTNQMNKNLSGLNDIYIIGPGIMSTELRELSEAVNKSFLNIAFDYRYDTASDPNRFFFRSDHYHYARKGIPIIAFFTGNHADYHRPSDSSDKIDYQKLEKVTRTIYLISWELASRPDRPKVDKQLPAQVSSN